MLNISKTPRPACCSTAGRSGGHHNFGKALWCRGNCWFTAASIDMTEYIDIPEPDKTAILNGYRKRCAALKKYQDASGLFHTLVDDPTAYLESSGSAGFIYGLQKGVASGVLDSSYRAVCQKGIDGLWKEIGPDGIVKNASYGTVVHMTKDYYKQIRLTSTGYGRVADTAGADPIFKRFEITEKSCFGQDSNTLT